MNKKYDIENTKNNKFKEQAQFSRNSFHPHQLVEHEKKMNVLHAHIQGQVDGLRLDAYREEIRNYLIFYKVLIPDDEEDPTIIGDLASNANLEPTSDEGVLIID